jgi:biopolymer transport protein ExbD
MQHAVRIDLPRASSQPEAVKPAHVDLAVEADGSILWDGHAVTDDGLRARIAQAAQATPQPELHLRADRKVPYERIADVMSAAQTGGLTKIGFVTNPQPRK